VVRSSKEEEESDYYPAAEPRNLEFLSPVSFMTAAAAGNPDHPECTRGNTGNTGRLVVG
jgi:hypothetical protein